ncbi:MAG TPA: murein L,D-transpeptidase catalytic domain family protein [Croceibacterium sp.]|nr:murein L,D-transpeptidase catalytic domain family protein [Croceibacterium sp.]
MEFSRRHFIGAALAAAAGASTASCVSAPRRIAMPAPAPPPLPGAPPAVAEAAPQTPVRAELPPLIAEALAALDTHGWRIANRDRVGVVDFTLPSREPRFHLVDVASGRIERSWLVAHGSGSDPAATGMLHRFSNAPGSNASSRGAYLTADAYYGKHGRSRRLIGLDPTNDLALDRAIVMHGADYVNPAMIAAQGRIGRSQGCFAFEPGEAATVMELLGEGRMIYASRLEGLG